MAINPIVDSRDVRFILFEMLKADDLLSYEKYSDYDKDTFEEVLRLAETIAIEQVYPINADSDKEGCQYDPETCEVKIPDAYIPALKAFYEAGFMGLSIDEEYGGMGMPSVINYAAVDYFTAASMAFCMYPLLGVGALNMYIKFMPDVPQKKQIIEKMLAGEWGGSMCLTESDAGSDVGALKTKAVKNDDGTYSIQGQKIFISSGDNNFYKNNVHPVLARIEGDPAGTGGISIFMVPKYRINEDGSLGEKNDLICTGVEHKMGLNASATCALNFGDNNGCHGLLLGEERKGMKIMFMMMNEARLYVGNQGMSVSSAAYMHAATYAKNRIQGRDVMDLMDHDAPAVPIIRHPDIKRLLLSMKARVEAMRSLSYYCGMLLDIEGADKTEKAREASLLLSFLIPINKAGNTDSAWDITADAIQVYGGYGYTREYPVEQYARDSKILSLYEGTNGIQAMDLGTRKLLMDDDQKRYKIYRKKIDGTIEQAKSAGVSEKYTGLMAKAAAKMDEVVEYLLTSMAMGQILDLFANATPLEKAFTTLTYGWMQLWGLAVATPKMKELVGDKKGEERDTLLKESKEAAFYSGRVLSGKYYVGTELYKFFGMCEAILGGENSVTKANETTFSAAPNE